MRQLPVALLVIPALFLGCTGSWSSHKATPGVQGPEDASSPAPATGPTGTPSAETGPTGPSFPEIVLPPETAPATAPTGFSAPEGKVWKNEDLENLARERGMSQPGTPGYQGKPNAAVNRFQQGREYWTAQADAARERISRIEGELSAEEQKKQALVNPFTRPAVIAGMSGPSGAKPPTMAEVDARIDQLQKGLDEARKAFDNLKEQARRQGVPAPWLEGGTGAP